MRSASSASATRITGSTGPKVSSRITAMSGVASAISVGAKKRPGQVGAPRAARDHAPAARDGVGDLALGALDLRREGDGADVDVRGVRLAERGRRPGAACAISAAHSSTNRSATAASTSTRSVRMQTWPLCAKPLHTAACAARGRSASASTIIGDLPPSSSTAGHQALGRRACATCRPAAALPVKKIMSAAAVSAAPASPRPATTWNTPSGSPGVAPQLRDAQRRQRRVLRRLERRRRCRPPAARRSRRSC